LRDAYSDRFSFGIYGLSILLGTERDYAAVNQLCEPYQVKFQLVPDPLTADMYTFIRKEEIEESPNNERVESKDDGMKEFRQFFLLLCSFRCRRRRCFNSSC
jgi:hypothetical protein